MNPMSLKTTFLGTAYNLKNRPLQPEASSGVLQNNFPSGDTVELKLNHQRKQPLLFGSQLNENQKVQKKPEDLCFQEFQAQLTQRGWDVKTLLQESVQDQNKLGTGGEATVFSIPGIEDYVLRVKDGRNGDTGKIKKGQFPSEPLVDVLDEFPDLNVGQAIASIGKIKVLKRQREYTLSLEKYKFDKAEYIKQYTELIAKIAALPLEAFEKLAETHVRVQQKGYFVDTDPTNTFLDTHAKTIGVVDVSQGKNPPPLTFLSLLRHFTPLTQQSVSEQPELITHRKTIFLNLIKAALKYHIPLHEPQFTSDYAKTIFWTNFDNILKQSGLSKSREKIISIFKQQAASND